MTDPVIISNRPLTEMELFGRAMLSIPLTSSSSRFELYAIAGSRKPWTDRALGARAEKDTPQ
jgi:hypothetical protein